MMARVMQLMMSGMLVLILPALVICTGVAVIAYRRRDATAASESDEPRPGA